MICVQSVWFGSLELVCCLLGYRKRGNGCAVLSVNCSYWLLVVVVVVVKLLVVGWLFLLFLLFLFFLLLLLSTRGFLGGQSNIQGLGLREANNSFDFRGNPEVCKNCLIA